MANDLRGEVEFEALGRRWMMKLGNGAVRSLEAETGKVFGAIGKELGDEETASLSLFTTVFLACLRKHHPSMTLDECDDIIDDIGQAEAGRLIGLAFERMNGKSRGGADRPQKATAK